LQSSFGVSGNTILRGTLSVSGNSILNNVDIGSSLNAANVNVNNNLTVSGTATITGATVLGTTLNVSGNTQLNSGVMNSLSVTGTTTLQGPSTMMSSLYVSGNTNLGGYLNVSGVSTFNNGLIYNVRTITTDTTLLSSDYIVAVNTNIYQTVTTTLPSDNLLNGISYIIHSYGTSPNVIVDGNSTNINGAASATINTSYTSLTLYYNSGLNEWIII
jgi:predicted acyltransferase (DUF342 family)